MSTQAILPERVSVPVSRDTEQTLVYKSVIRSKRIIELEFDYLSPINQVYDKAPVYYVIPGGGGSSCDKKNMLNFWAFSIVPLR